MNIFDKSAKDWDKETERIRFQQQILDEILSTVDLTREMTVIEYGCGTGNAALAIASHVKKVFGLDSSPGMLEEAGKKVNPAGITNISFQAADLSVSQWTGDKADFIFSSLTLHHIRDVHTLLKNLIAALKPGGKLALADLEPEDGTFHSSNEGVAHFGFDPAELGAALGKCGLKNIRCRTVAVRTRVNDDGSARGAFPVFMLTADK